MSEIAITGLASNLENEERALAYLEVNHNNLIYNWQIFIPKNTENLSVFLESQKQKILDDIDFKENIWSNLEPKTRTINDPITNQEIQVEISKDEIVKPDIPDYYAHRRNEYPSLGDQLDAMWKGVGSQDFLDMQSKITAIKEKYPKP